LRHGVSWRREDAARAEEGYAIVTGLFISAGESKGGFLAKRISNSAGESPVARINRAAKTAQREYVPLEDDPTAAGNAPEDAADAPANESAKPSMREVFGPGGWIPRKVHGRWV